jgi:hypothetical protein
VSGSIAQPEAVTVPEEVASASMRPNGSEDGTTAVVQPSVVASPGPTFTA